MSTPTTITGTIGKDATTQNGYTRASVAVYNGKTKDGARDTVWFAIKSKTDAFVGKDMESLSKGDRVMVSGRLVFDRWTDKQGNETMTPTIWVDNILVQSKAAPKRRDDDGGGFNGNDDLDGIPF